MAIPYSFDTPTAWEAVGPLLIIGAVYGISPVALLCALVRKINDK